MNLRQACCNILDQLSTLTEHLSDAEFVKPIESLSQATLGQHLRHTLEFFICLESGFEEGTVNYDERMHDKVLETDRSVSLSTISRIRDFVEATTEDKPFNLSLSYGEEGKAINIRTNYSRELVYNIEHAVHHMALIKIGVREVASHIALPAEFGIASSTIRYKETSKSTSN